MKTIFIDTNLVNDNGSVKIDEFIINNMELQKGERVFACQEGDCWEAEIVYEDTCWCVKLLSETKEVSKERQMGQEEGFWNGYYVQSMRMLRVLQSLNYSSEEIKKVKEKLDIK